MSKTIKLKNYGNNFEEFIAASAIKPGHLIELTSANKVQSHSTSGGNVLKLFALEDSLQGKGITDAYAANDPVQAWFVQPGDQVNAILANGENVVIGDFLSSNGNGELKKYVIASSAAVIEYPEVIVAVARKAVDMSGSSAVDPDGFIPVTIV